MELWAYIDPHGPGVVTFDPGKVLQRIKDVFPGMTCDYHDHAMARLDSLQQFFRDYAVPDERRQTMERQTRHSTAENGPVYLFAIERPDGSVITGSTRRYRTTFRTATLFDPSMEAQLIALLRGFKVGFILCDTPTRQFTVPAGEENPEVWTLPDQEPWW